MNDFFAILLILSLIFLLYCAADTSADNSTRYLLMQNQVLFDYSDSLPFEILQPMCWDEQLGWCDAGMEESGHRVVYLIDFEVLRHGVVMENATGCWLWMFHPDYGEDEQPHIAEANWITCFEFERG